MSKLEVYAVRDKAVGAYLPPLFVRSRGEILRMFTATTNDEKHDFNRFASDYSLYFLGYYDDNAGLFESADPVRVVGAIDVIVPFPEFQPPGDQPTQ